MRVEPYQKRSEDMKEYSKPTVRRVKLEVRKPVLASCAVNSFSSGAAANYPLCKPPNVGTQCSGV